LASFGLQVGKKKNNNNNNAPKIVDNKDSKVGISNT